MSSILMLSYKIFWSTSVVPKYLTFYTCSKDLSAIFVDIMGDFWINLLQSVVKLEVLGKRVEGKYGKEWWFIYLFMYLSI